MRSIRRRLLQLLAGVLVLTFTISGLLGYLATAEEVQELFDAQLIENARVLKGVMNHKASRVDWEEMRKALEETRDDSVGDDDPMADGHAYEKKVAIQVWSPDGGLVLRSPSAPDYSLSPLRHGFYTRRHNGFHWHVYTTRMQENGYWLIVAERSDVREELSLNVAASLFAGALIGLGLALYLMRRSLQRELQPLAELQGAIGERAPEKLTPISLAEPRVELQPVVEALNHLLDRVTTSVERERRFLADAAHELRTPLAVLRLQAQGALAAGTPEEQRPHLDRLLAGVDRSTRVVEQLLLLARLDADVVALDKERLALDVLAREIIASLVPLALLRHQELELACADGGDFQIEANSALLGALLRNLVDNAMRHSPEAGRIGVSLHAGEHDLRLEVCDSGPGVDPVMLGALTRRFVRAHQGDSQGTGLGLAIVAHIVELHDGRLELENLAPNGLKVSVTLPRRPA